MATSQSMAVKCLNTSSGRKRFVFKSFSQRVEEINIDVFRSLDPVKAEPSRGTSFFLESLVQWRELNTAEDFISFYDEMMPLVQTLPQVILHREKIFSELIKRLNVKARLSLEPILMLVAALSRDILEDFMPFLQNLTSCTVDLLKDGGDRDPEILEQVFTSWSYILMHLQKYLVKDLVHILKITLQLRFFSKDYVREFMAEAVSFLLRNAPIEQLMRGLRKVIFEVAKISSSTRKAGVTALLWHVIRGTSSRLHSRADKVLRFLMDKSILRINDKYPEGSVAVLEVISGIFDRLCSEVDQKELKVMYTCLSEETKKSISDGCVEHLNHMLVLLIDAINKSNQRKTFDVVTIVELVQLLVDRYIMPANGMELENQSSEILNRILQLLLCLLDVPLFTSDLVQVSQLYTPVFRLRSPSLLPFIKELLVKDPQVAHIFGSRIISVIADYIEDSPEEALFILLKLFDKQNKLFTFDGVSRESEDKVKKLFDYCNMKLCLWVKLLDDTAASSRRSDKLFSELEPAILWGVLNCYPHFPNLEDNLSSVKVLIAKIDQFIDAEADCVGGLSKSTWHGLLGAALASYSKFLLVRNSGNSEIGLFLSLAKRHKTSPQVLSAVAEFLETVLGYSGRCPDEAYSSQRRVHDFDAESAANVFCTFANNLSISNKAVRVSTLRILSYYSLLDQQLRACDERPNKRLKIDESVSGNEDIKCTNVIELLLSVETSPLSIATGRKIIILISRIQMSLSSGKINDDYIPLLLNGILGILYNRFSYLWQPALECLAILISNYKDLVWDMFVSYLGTHQAKSLSFGDQLLTLNSGSPQPLTLVDCFNLYVAPDFDCTPCMTVTVLLLQALQKISHIAESRSRQLIPLFLNFMGYNDDKCVSVGLYTTHKCKGKDWRMILKEWLNLLKLMHDARSLYQSRVLKEVLVKRLLDEVDPEIQLKVLDCLLNWKDGFLIPYDQHLRNLVVSKNLREELTTWSFSQEHQSIQEEHRGHLVPLIVRLLTPKVRKLKTLGSRKHTGVSHRKAILRFFLQFDVNELHLFFCLLLKPLLPGSLVFEVFDSQSNNLSGNFTDEPVLVKLSLSITVDNLPLKNSNGFLHVLEDILETFDVIHIEPFLNPLLMIVVRMLERCMCNLAGENCENTHPAGDNSSAILKGNQKDIMAPDSIAMNISINQFKDLRSLCLKIIYFALCKYEGHDFSSNFWGIFFTSVKPLIDSFKQEGSSSEKPSSLFLCFVAMSQNPVLVSLLGRQTNLIPTIFSILTVKTASDAIISCVLTFIENLLKLDNDVDHQGNDLLKRVLEPHMEVLIQSFHDLFQSRKEFHRKFTIWPGQRELRIFKLLVKYIKDPKAAACFVDILLPFFRKKDVNSDEQLEGFLVVKEIVPILDFDATGKILSAIQPLLVTAGSDLRLCVCDILDNLASRDPSLVLLARLLRELNAVSAQELGEVDYDTRIKAYDAINRDLFSQMKEEHAVAILSHCVYDMSSGELIFRQSASRALQTFLEFVSSVPDMLLHDGSSKISTDLKSAEDNIGTWTKTCIHRIVEKTYLQNMGEAMKKDISIQKEWIALLRNMVYSLQHPSLTSFRSLCSEDPEVDFFNNILHLQIHRRTRALSRFRNAISSGQLSEDVTMKIFVQLFFNMLFDVKDGKGEHLRNACVETLASIASQVQWESYRTILMRSFRELTIKPDKRKILLRLICAILDVFHFFDMHSSNAVKAVGDDACVSDDVSLCNSSSQIVPSEKQQYLQKVVLPQVQKLVASESDSEKVNVSISLVALKLLKLLPVEVMESQLSTVVHHVCSFLKNRLESIRGDARSCLAACLKELGLEYLQFIVKILQAILKRGYELHVLGYTVNFILSKTLPHATTGKLDYCLEELLSVIESDILGDVGEEKEVDKIASKMKETRKNKSFDTLKLVAESITFRTHAPKLLSPINTHLQKHLTPKMKTKIEMMLHYIALGIECNPSAEHSELFVFVYGLIEDTTVKVSLNNKEASMIGTNQNSVQKVNRRNFWDANGSGSQNAHVITKFSLGLLLNRLKKMKLDKKDEQLLSLLDPFVELLGGCLNSKYEDVLSAAFRCLGPLIGLPLPSLETQADKIKILLLDIAQKSGKTNSLLMQSCLRLLILLLQSCRISLSNDQLYMLIHFPIFIDLQTNPSPIALSLLKSIVSRKLVVHEIYDIVMRVAELMVTSQSEPIRKKCSQILLQFLLDYRLSDKRLQQHLDFLLTNLSYEHSSGREAVLEMLHAILIKFPKSVVDSQAQTFFLHLVVALANDHEHKVCSMVASVIKVLIGRVSQHSLHPIIDYSLSWYMGDKQHLWSAAAQVLGLLVEVLKKGFLKYMDNILIVAKRILEASTLAAGNVEDFSNEAGTPFWKEAYYSLVMLEKILFHFPEQYFKRNIEDVWVLICKLLRHPHIWLRNISSRLVALYFTGVSEARRSDNEKLRIDSFSLVDPSRLFVIAVSFMNQLKRDLSDDAANNLIVQNLVFSVCGLHSFCKQRQISALDQFWSTLSSAEQGCYIESFELLGSRKAKNKFLLSTTSRSVSSVQKDQPNYDTSEDLQSLLVAPLLKRMGKIAMDMEDVQMKIIFSCFRLISSQIGSGGSLAYAVHLLLPLYKVCEGFAGKVISDEIKQLADEVRDSIRDVIGVDNFVQVYNQIRKNLKHRRESRKQVQKVLAVVNPMRYAKRKLRISAKHREHKKRKVMSMKMTKWRR
ncbi:uncharacterized protein [Typha latifolia]|uniref:uncharacterized protein isoform X1 n=2 Tax=Typha latifolia TaxID=4733 RepID=UPI003C309F45